MKRQAQPVLGPDGLSRKIRIGLICVSAVPDDPRVRRQGDVFHASGYDVVAVGLPGYQSERPAWKYCHVGSLGVASDNDGVANDAGEPLPLTVTELQRGNAAPVDLTLSRLKSSPIWPVARAVYRRLRQTAALSVYRRLRQTVTHRSRQARRVSDLGLVHVSDQHALKVYWRLNSRFAELHEVAARQEVDFWIANDWTTLPIVLKLKQQNGTPFGYDTHELAVDEYAQDLKWRLTQRPVIAGIERCGIREAEFVTCVSDGIADRLQEIYRLGARPLLVRNTPQYTPSAFRPTGETIRVLYHGVVSPGRALEESIASVPHWRPEFSLTIRGPSSPDYLAALKTIAATHGVEDRVTFAPSVPMTELVTQARAFDVGLFAIKGHSLQNSYVLPNKFFEYAMAGLALCVSDLPEMRRLLQQFDMGCLIETVTPEEIAAAVNGLDRAMIDSFKSRALVAAKDLCWEHEGQKFIDLTRSALSRRMMEQD